MFKTKHVFMNEAGGVDTNGGTPEKKKRGPKVNLLNIVRGRMPLACVAAIRFVEKADTSNADVAKKYATSVGKVFDIRKGRNFEYITADFKPTDEHIKEAEAWAKQAAEHGGDEAAIMASVDKLGKATEEEAKAQGEAITKARSKGPRTPKAKTEAGTGEGTGTGGDPASLLS